MSLGAIKAGAAFVELTLRDKTDAGLRRAQGRFAAFAAGVKTIATGIGVFAGVVGAIAAPFAIVAKTFADAGSNLHDMALRTGLATDNLSELKYAAEQTGTSLEAVEKAIRFMQKQGLDAKKFDEILLAVSKIADESERAAAAQKLFGRGGTALLAMAKELPALRQQARDLGVSMSPRQAALADELGDEFGRFKTALRGLSFQLGEALAPSLIAITASLVGAIQATTAFTATLMKSAQSIQVSTASWLEGFAAKDLGPRGEPFRQLLKWLQGKPSLFDRAAKAATPDFSDLLDMKAGGTSRGQVGGFRAESLSVGSGGGTIQKLGDIKAVLERIRKAAEANVVATKAIDTEDEFQ